MCSGGSLPIDLPACHACGRPGLRPPVEGAARAWQMSPSDSADAAAHAHSTSPTLPSAATTSVCLFAHREFIGLEGASRGTRSLTGSGGLFVDDNRFAAPDRQRVAPVEFRDVEAPRARGDFRPMDWLLTVLLPFLGRDGLPLSGGGRGSSSSRFDDCENPSVRFHVLGLDPAGDHFGLRRSQRVVKVLPATFSANGFCGGLREATV